MSIFVSPYNPVQQSGVRAKNPPDLVIATRPPTTKDFSYFVGQLWVYLNNAYYGLVGVATGGTPSGQWVLFAGTGGVLNTINLVPPVLNNINLVDFFSALNDGAIRVSTPATVPATAAGTIGLGVKVDGVTIQINGADELEAIAVAPPLTLQGDVPSAAQPYLANNFTFQGIPTNGAIEFNSSAPGVMDAAVQVDGVTIDINASNQLEVVNSQVSAVITTVGAVTSPLFTIPLGVTPGTYTFEIDVAAFCFFGPDSPGSVGYTLVGAVRTTGAAAILVPGQALDEFEEAALAAADVDINVAANNAVINVTGVLADSIRWSGTLKFVFQG